MREAYTPFGIIAVFFLHKPRRPFEFELRQEQGKPLSDPIEALNLNHQRDALGTRMLDRNKAKAYNEYLLGFETMEVAQGVCVAE